MDYSFLCNQYPEIITMDQLYCHISKRKARWLLENGIIPCEDSGKQTRRFRIKLDDVIEFLELRKVGLLDDVIPVGIFTSAEYGYSSRQPRTRLDNGALQVFLLDYWVDVSDMLTVPQTVVALGGYSVNTLERCRSIFRKVFAIRGITLISKESLVKWPTSDEEWKIQRQSAIHQKLREKF